MWTVGFNSDRQNCYSRLTLSSFWLKLRPRQPTERRQDLAQPCNQLGSGHKSAVTQCRRTAIKTESGVLHSERMAAIALAQPLSPSIDLCSRINDLLLQGKTHTNTPFLLPFCWLTLLSSHHGHRHTPSASQELQRPVSYRPSTFSICGNL